MDDWVCLKSDIKVRSVGRSAVRLCGSVDPGLDPSGVSEKEKVGRIEIEEMKNCSEYRYAPGSVLNRFLGSVFDYHEEEI